MQIIYWLSVLGMVYGFGRLAFEVLLAKANAVHFYPWQRIEIETYGWASIVHWKLIYVGSLSALIFFLTKNAC